MSTAAQKQRERITGTSNLCIRKLHPQCTIPETCLCACHDDAPPKAAPASILPGGMIWEEPPPKRSRGALPLLDEAQKRELKANPKRWARVRNYASKSAASGAAKRYRQGRAVGLELGDWELEGRTLEGGRSALWARYLGEPR